VGRWAGGKHLGCGKKGRIGTNEKGTVTNLVWRKKGRKHTDLTNPAEAGLKGVGQKDTQKKKKGGLGV